MEVSYNELLPAVSNLQREYGRLQGPLRLCNCLHPWTDRGSILPVIKPRCAASILMVSKKLCECRDGVSRLTRKRGQAGGAFHLSESAACEFSSAANYSWPWSLQSSRGRSHSEDGSTSLLAIRALFYM